MNGDTSDDVDELPPSAKFVVFVLEESGGTIGRDELADRTGLPDRTLSDAISRLEELDVVRRDRDGSDLRFVEVALADSA